MTAEPSVDSRGVAAAEAFRRAGWEVGRWSAATLLGLLLTAALLLGWRRLAGALHHPLQPALLLSVGGLVAAAGVAVRLVWQYVPGGYRPRALRWPVALLPSASVLALGAALSLPETAAGGLVGFWILLAAEELWAWRPEAWRRLLSKRQASLPLRRLRPDPAQAPSPHAPPRPAAAERVPPDEVLQQLTRSQADDGSEQLSGWLRMRFAAGQRTGSVHVAFCPPFAKTPELAVEQTEGPPARLKTAQLLPHGTRLDVKLGATAERSLAVLLRFSARSRPPAEPAWETGRREGT